MLILDNLGKKIKVLIPAVFFILSNNSFPTKVQPVGSQTRQERASIFISS